MNKFERLIEDVLSYEEVMKTPRRPLSAKAKAAIRAGLAETFGKTQVLSEAAMRLTILKFLKKGTLTGAEVIEKLKASRFEMNPKGQGVILGLLDQMADRGLVFATLDEETATRRYKIEEAGSKLLEKDGSMVLGGLGLSVEGNV